MAQPQNNMTFYIPDPNGGQPQMIKVVGTTKLPFQLATSSGLSAGATTIKTFIKTSTPAEHVPPGTIIRSNKVNNRLIAVPTKPGGNIPNIRGPMIVPVSGIQIKPVQSREQQSVASILSGRASATISSPMVIKTQSRSLTMSTSSISNSIPTSINLSQINVCKQGQHQTIYSAPLLQAHLKQQPTGISSKPQSFSIKTQSSIHSQKSSELILIPQKQTHEVNTTQKIKVQPPVPRQPQIGQQQLSQTHGVSPPKSLMNTSILDHSGSRKRHDFDFDYSVESKRRKTEKCGKGLRHFSMKVCEKVQAKGTTSYNEVADELVNEFSESNRANSPAEGANYDQKNIRRRVYDALNVLMAMNIISKEKKEIHWLGLPTNSLQECHNLETERKKRLQKIKLKTQQLQDLILQQIAFKNLVERNRKMEKDFGAPSPNSAIQLPFIIVNTSKKTVIDCSISNDKTEYLFNFDNTFEIHDDIEVLKRMGMALGLEKGKCSASDLEKAKSIIPKTLESYVVELAENHSEAQFEIIDENGTPQAEELDSAVNSIYNGEFTFEKAGVDNNNLRQKSESISRHSSLLSLSQDQRTESASPSSFGEYDDDTMEESDIDIN